MYDYFDAVKGDILEAVRDRYAAEDFQGMDKEEIYEKLNENLWVDDGVTGNASGSYYCNAYDAEEAICHNLDLLGEALEEFGGGCEILKDGAESADVTIRCYVLGQVLGDAIDELEENGFFDMEEDEEEG